MSTHMAIRRLREAALSAQKLFTLGAYTEICQTFITICDRALATKGPEAKPEMLTDHGPHNEKTEQEMMVCELFRQRKCDGEFCPHRKHHEFNDQCHRECHGGTCIPVAKPMPEERGDWVVLASDGHYEIYKYYIRSHLLRSFPDAEIIPYAPVL